MIPPSPALSVVLVSLGDAAALGRAVAAIALACEGIDAELVLPLPERRRTQVPEVPPHLAMRVVFAAADGDDPWVLRAVGVRAAHAPIVATLEDHALPTPGYGAQVLAAHATNPRAAIGGVVDKTAPDGATGWAMYFLDYGRYIPPRSAGATRWLSACNVTYKRAALDRVASSWPHHMHETTVHLALLAAGEELWLDPGLVVDQHRHQSLADARAELRRHGAAFGRDLAAHVGLLARALRLLSAPLIPVVQLVRAGSHLRRTPHLIPEFARATPVLATLAVAWAGGEVRGLIGARGGPRHVTP
ncbi:MAG: hypothetical protein IPK85_11850 [Gemmatimonadetes bacterium]|nr:hypothetical protein [Gemmatimonadota bacterium]